MSSVNVRISELTAHPRNARVGDVAAIAESLVAHGQYRPIVVSTATGHILAGNHTYRAAKSLGWDHVAVTYVDADEDEEMRILLADNRTSDRASYNVEMLCAVVEALPDLHGTGFTEDDLDALRGEVKMESVPLVRDDDASRRAQVRLGPYRLDVEDAEWSAWEDRNLTGDTEADKASLSARLLVPAKAPVVKQVHPERLPGASEAAAISELNHWKPNPRQGDIGAIAESLLANGQFRPIVVNRPTMTVLVGNHTMAAARSLGWEHVEVVYVDVDTVDAARIVLVDNRTSDLATYDEVSLDAMLMSLPDFVGTGWHPDDVGDLTIGRKTVPPAARGRKMNVGKVGWMLDAGQWSGFCGTLPDPDDIDVCAVVIGKRLDLTPDSWKAGF